MFAHLSNLTFSNLYNYRNLIRVFVKRDLSSRYAGSILGLYWAIINPLITLTLYFLIFGVFLKTRMPGSTNLWDFALYFSSGFFPWVTFNSSVIRASTSIIDNKNFIKKIAFPNEIFPVYTILSESITLIIGLSIFLTAFIIIKGMPSIFIIFLPIAILLQLIFTFSLGLFFSSVTVFFRDTPQILNSIFMIWFWVTPIVYPTSSIPHKIAFMLFLNPAFYLLETYRDILFLGRAPQLNNFLIFASISFLSLFLTILFFNKIKRSFCELI